MMCDFIDAWRPGDTCPTCRSESVYVGLVTEKGVQLDVCGTCAAMWEREIRAAPLESRCDNCAFRKGSPEQEDPEMWQRIVAKTIHKNGIFYCHKRIAVRVVHGGLRFDFQHDEHGNCINATACAGWLEAKIQIAAKRKERN